MTLDDDQVGQLELARRDRERDWADAEADWREREATESVEALEAYWAGAFAARGDHWSGTQHWDGT